MIEFVARPVGVDASDLRFYECSGRTIEYHRNQIRGHLGFRVATVSDQERWTAWLASNVTHAERRPERVREELLAQLRAERIEPPTTGRVLRMVRSALRTAEHEAAAARELLGHTPFATPEPVALGRPGAGYPLPWSGADLGPRRRRHRREPG